MWLYINIDMYIARANNHHNAINLWRMAKRRTMAGICNVRLNAAKISMSTSYAKYYELAGMKERHGNC